MSSRLFIFIIALLISAFNCHAEKDIMTKARRGDTWQSLAKKYDIDVVELKAANGNLVECTAGMEVIIPGHLLQAAREKREREAQFQKDMKFIDCYLTASDYFEKGKYKEAVKECDNILSFADEIDVYYLRAISQYNRKKWGNAISDFSHVLESDDASADMKEHASELLNNAKQFKIENDNKKAELWGSLIMAGTAVATGAIMAATANNGNSSSSYGSQTSGRSKNKAGGLYRKSTRSYSSSSGKSYSTRSSSSSSHLTAGEIEANRLMAESDQRMKRDMAIAQQYFDPATFVSNVQLGRNTLPSAQEMGYTGLNAYAYDVERNLQYRSQLMDLQSQRMTEELVKQGQGMAQKEIENFKLVYGREPTSEEASEIYRKYTQGYVDAYSDYVKSGVETNKELGLGEIERTKVHSENVGGITVTKVTTDKDYRKPISYTNSPKESRQKSESHNQQKDSGKQKQSGRVHSKNNKGKSTSTKEKGAKNHDGSVRKEEKTKSVYYEYKQTMVNLYEPSKHKFPTIKNCKIYLKGTDYYVEIKGQKCKIEKSNKSGFNRSVSYNNTTYYFNY